MPITLARTAPLPAVTGPRHRRRAPIAGLLLSLILATAPAGAQAATTTFGSNLSVPATLDTAHNLNYGASAAPSHDGADTALWNVAQAAGAPTAPADGQVLSVKLEGCAQPAGAGAPAPLTQFHFQSLEPQGGRAVKVGVTTQPFDIPVCGQNGAGASTITTYQPTNFCVKQGDYVDFNDEGGFSSQYYPSGVPYQVIGSVSGSTMDSFIGDNQTNNGSTLSPGTTTSHSGFASNANEELMMQATLGTGPDATPLCPGGTAGEPATSSQPTASTPAPGGAQTGGKLALKIRSQTDGVSHGRVVKLAIFCAQTSPCTGSVSVFAGATKLGSGTLYAPGHKTSHISVRLSAKAVRMIRKHHRHIAVMMVVTLSSGQSFKGPITLKI